MTKTVKLGEIIKVKSGVNLTQHNMKADGLYPVYGGNGINGKHSLFNVMESTIVIGRVGYYCGSVHLTEGKAWVTDNAFIVKFPYDSVSHKFLYYMLGNLNLGQYSNSSAQPVISGSKISNICCRSLPDLDTQRHIAAILDRTDALRQKDRQLLAYYEQLPQAVFLEMFGDPVRNEKGWEVDALENLIIEGPQNGLYKPATDYGTGTPILRIDSFYDGSVSDIDKLKRVRVSEKEQKLYQIHVQDIVINRVNSRSHLGKSALIPKLSEPTVFESNMMRIKVDESKVVPAFLIKMLCQDFVKRQILERAKDAVNQSSINQQDVLSFVVLVPPLSLQTQFAETIARIEQQKAIAKQQLATSEALFQSLLHQFFGQGAT